MHEHREYEHEVEEPDAIPEVVLVILTAAAFLLGAFLGYLLT